MAASAVYRAKTLLNRAVFVGPIRSGNKDGIPLISLHVFKVFHKKRLKRTLPFSFILIRIIMLNKGAIHFHFNEGLLRFVHGSNAKTFIRMITHKHQAAFTTSSTSFMFDLATYVPPTYSSLTPNVSGFLTGDGNSTRRLS